MPLSVPYDPRTLKTYVAKPSERRRDWLVVDAEGQTLGRLATRIADALRGKRKPEYTPHVDTGDFVVVVNAEKIRVTGKKIEQKRYWRHSGYPGGIKSRTLAEMLDRRPEEVIRKAVKGMLPRNRLARKQLTKLKVYAGPDHPHAAQKPQPMEIELDGRRAAGRETSDETCRTRALSPRACRDAEAPDLHPVGHLQRPQASAAGDARLEADAGRGAGAVAGREPRAGCQGGEEERRHSRAPTWSRSRSSRRSGR